MKKHAWLISSALVVASSVATVVVGCGSDAATIAGPGSTPDGSGQVPSGGDDQDGSTPTGSIPDGGPVYNPTPDASTSTPAGAGMVTCGATACNTATEACCSKVAFGDGGFNTTTTCQPKADSCQGGSFACDEASDCATGEVCCRTLAGASCKAGSCQFPAIQVCSGSTECANDGGACAEHTCKVAQTEYTVMACSKPIGCQ